MEERQKFVDKIYKMVPQEAWNYKQEPYGNTQLTYINSFSNKKFQTSYMEKSI